ncbi:MAG: alpha-isopropylmalate synthase regulatory domain-containing protein [archaeon]|jgi:D-citramalate synthase
MNKKKISPEIVEVLDTTLRDGEQTEGVSFSAQEKLLIAQKLLKDVKVDRIEIASALVSGGEQEACRGIFSWAKKEGMLERIEVLGFVDIARSVDWISEAGGKCINLLCKGSEKHCLGQLKKKPEEHFEDIRKTVGYAKSKDFIVNAYLEDFSNGFQESKEYANSLIEVLVKTGVERVMLPDTLGILSPEQTKKFVSEIVSNFPNQKFDFHAHNDYGLATANSLEGVLAGASGVHCTVNGLGERTGNAALEEVVVCIHDFSGKRTNVSEASLASVSKMVEIFSKQRVSRNKPIVGQTVFTQTAGIHADGDKKGNLYRSTLSPERFERKTIYALGKLSGKSSIELALREFGITLDKETLSMVLKRVIELGAKKEIVTKEDLLFIIDEAKKEEREKLFSIVNYEIKSSSNGKPFAKIEVSLRGKKFEEFSEGDGGYDAFMNALRKIFAKNGTGFPELADYEVRIPVGGKTDALVETKISWKMGGKNIETTGVSTDQMDAAVKATAKMINIFLRFV